MIKAIRILTIVSIITGIGAVVILEKYLKLEDDFVFRFIRYADVVFKLFIAISVLSVVTSIVMIGYQPQKFWKKFFTIAFLIGFVVILLPTLFVLYSSNVFVAKRARAQHEMICHIGGHLLEYAKNHNNRLPEADDWCNILIKYSGDVAFSRNAAYRCDTAFNRNVGGWEVARIPSDTVLIFNAYGDWNLTGGSELLQAQGEQFNPAYIYFIDGTTGLYYFTKEDICINYKYGRKQVKPFGWGLQEKAEPVGKTSADN
jgi:hypothetical protein